MASTKSICKSATDKGFELYAIKYKGAGYGYDVVWNDHGKKWIIASIEPVHYRNGDRWAFFPKGNENGGIGYYKRLDQVAKRMLKLNKFISYSQLNTNNKPINKPLAAPVQE